MFESKFWNCLMVVLISIFLIKVAESACPSGSGYVSINGGACYKFYNNLAVNYSEAQSRCAGDGAHLAYIPDCTKFSFLARHLIINENLKANENGYWIGASDEEEEGDWIWGNGYPVRMGVPFWGTSGDDWVTEPNGRGQENCAQLSNDDQYYFHDEDCLGEGSPLCEIDIVESLSALKRSNGESYKYESVSCPSEFDVYIGKSCFYFGNNETKVTFKDAYNICRKRGGSLPILKDCIEFQELVEEIEKNYSLGPDESYWIGAIQNDLGSWIWVDATPMDNYLTFWGSTNGTAEPSGGNLQRCAMLYKNDRYYIHDGECNKGTRILCQYSP